MVADSKLRLFCLLFSIIGSGLAVSPVSSAPLGSPRITRLHQKVVLVDPASGKRPAAVSDVVSGDRGVQTSVDSRAELTFADGTLTRLAANTLFSSKARSREMDLSRGALLFQIPKGVGSTRINTADVTAAMSGATGFVERAGGTYKLVVLEGTVRVHLRSRARQSMLVHGGQMLIAPLASRSLKDWSTVDFDVARIMQTSVLVNPDLFAPLPTAATKLIAGVIASQRSKVAQGELNPTNIVLAGGVSAVQLVEAESHANSKSLVGP